MICFTEVFCGCECVGVMCIEGDHDDGGANIHYDDGGAPDDDGGAPDDDGGGSDDGVSCL
jgi:hypothetical protein